MTLPPTYLEEITIIGAWAEQSCVCGLAHAAWIGLLPNVPARLVQRASEHDQSTELCRQRIAQLCKDSDSLLPWETVQAKSEHRAIRDECLRQNEEVSATWDAAEIVTAKQSANYQSIKQALLRAHSEGRMDTDTRVGFLDLIARENRHHRLSNQLAYELGETIYRPDPSPPVP